MCGVCTALEYSSKKVHPTLACVLCEKSQDLSGCKNTSKKDDQF